MSLSPSARRELQAIGFLRTALADAEDILRLGRSLGEVIATRPGGDLLDVLTPKDRIKALPKSLSALHGTGPFPFHTDAAHHRRPPRWLILRCERPGPSDRPTHLVDSAMLKLSPADRRALQRAVWWVRSGARAFPASIISTIGGAPLIRYDPGCMTPADPSFVPSKAILENALSTTAPAALQWEQGEAVVIDNWRFLHARAKGDGDAGKRILQRVLVR